MTDFENYKDLLDKSKTKYEVWQHDTQNVVGVENSNAYFYLSFDILTGIISEEVILGTNVYCE
jgi:hypothetical protein